MISMKLKEISSKVYSVDDKIRPQLTERLIQVLHGHLDKASNADLVLLPEMLYFG